MSTRRYTGTTVCTARLGEGRRAVVSFDSRYDPSNKTSLNEDEELAEYNRLIRNTAREVDCLFEERTWGGLI